MTFHATHVAESEENCYNHCIPDEILQHVEVSELPPATLTLKKSCPVILICNINVADGLCNDTHLKITHLHQKLIVDKILQGPCTGQEQCLFQVQHDVDEEQLGYHLMQKQFPIQLCFAMTINKAQGQSLQTVDVDL